MNRAQILVLLDEYADTFMGYGTSDARAALISAIDVALAQPTQPAPRRLTEAEITLLVEAYYEDFGSAPPDLIRQVEGLIFGGAQPAQPSTTNGGKTGWPPGLLQDDCHALSRWLSSRPDAMYQLRKLYSEQEAQPAHAHAIDTSPGWLPIESAPKEFTPILLHWAGKVVLGYWHTNGGKTSWHPSQNWHTYDEFYQTHRNSHPTHWQPLPAAPSTKEGQQ